MSTPPAAKQAASGSEPPKGLPLGKFLSTLDWASDTHPASTEVAESGSIQTCIACTRPVHDSSEDVAGSTDKLEGFVVFRVAREHRLAFSPLRSSERASWRLGGVLSVFDAKLRLAVHTTDDGAPRCLTVDTHKILKPLELTTTSSVFRLELTFPFVTVGFEQERPKPPASGTERGGSTSSGVRLTVMRDAITELLEGPSSSDHGAAMDTGGKKAADFISLYGKQLEEKGKDMKWTETGMREIFSRFEARCTTMTMPPSFPYMQPQSAYEGLSVDQSNHTLFVEAFLQQEVTRNAMVKQAEAWVQLATKQKDYGEDKMLSREEIEARRGGVRRQQR